MKTWIFSLILILIVFDLLTVGAQELEEVVVTGTRLETLERDLPAFVSVIGVKEKDRGLLLEESPGVNINSYGAFGDLLSPSIRGSTSDQVLILLDGMRVPKDGLTFITLENIERIEVFRGGASALYGSDSIGGVINLVRRRRTGTPIYVNLGAGSYGTYRVGGGVELSGQDYRYALTLLHEQSEGDFKYRYRGEELVRRNNGYARDGVTFDLNYKIKGYKLGFGEGLHVQDKEVPGSYFTPTPDAREWDLLNHTTLSLDRSINSTRLSLNCALSLKRLKYYDEIFVKRATPSTSQNLDAELIFKLDKELFNDIFSLAPEIRTESIDGSQTGRHSRYRLALFSQYESRAGKLIVIPAFRTEFYSDAGVTSTERLGIRLNLLEWLYFKANAGSSFRVPTFLDLYWPEDAFARGNPDLLPEKGIDGDAGVALDGGFLKFEIAFFHNFIKDMIQWLPQDDGKWSPLNIGRAEIYGIESTLRSKLLDFLNLNLSSTYLKSRDLTQNSPYYGKELVYRPGLLLNGGLRFNFRKFFVILDGVYNSRRFTDRENRIENELQGYTRVDMKLGYSHSNSFSAGFSVRNLTNTRYEEVRGYPQPGINFDLEINYKL